MEKTISQILNEFRDFNKAFWATYSLDFETLDFLLRNDLKQIMNPCYLHIICDGNKLDEAIALNEKNIRILRKLNKLQEYCTISAQFTEGSFHPKIIFFASKNSLLVIITSANATSSGILSNQDMIGLYYYDKNHKESLDEIIAIFQYLKSFPGWGKEALEDFKIVEEKFSFLQTKIATDKVLFIPNENHLLKQIQNSLPNPQKIEYINIFSPFLMNHSKLLVKSVRCFQNRSTYFLLKMNLIPLELKVCQRI